jgi:hypothetical protein
VSDDAIDAARQLHTALHVLATDSVLDGATVHVPSLNVSVRVAEAKVSERTAMVVYDVEGIQVLAAGLDDDREKALGEAAFQWATGVFTTVRHWLAPDGHTCLVSDRTLQLGGSAWRAHLGPILSRAFGDDAENVEVPVQPHDIVELLAPHLAPADREPFWIEAYVARHIDGSTVSTCRLRNEEWAEGQRAMEWWARGWNIEGALVSVRQFLLFEPVKPRGGWWRRLVGG